MTVCTEHCAASPELRSLANTPVCGKRACLCSCWTGSCHVRRSQACNAALTNTSFWPPLYFRAHVCVFGIIRRRTCTISSNAIHAHHTHTYMCGNKTFIYIPNNNKSACSVGIEVFRYIRHRVCAGVISLRCAYILTMVFT